MKRMKKGLSLILACLVLLLGIGNTFGMIAYAESVIEIDTASELRKIGVDAEYPLTGSYKLTADIDLSGTTWTVIGGIFSGVFDGNGHTISGMTSGSPDAPYTTTSGWGIFTELSGTVKNLKLEDLYFNVGAAGGEKPVGGICGYIRDGAVVENVYMSGSITDVTSHQVRAGAIAGSARSAFTIKNCYIDVDITGGYGDSASDRQAGIAGLVGSTKQTGTISDCVYVGDVTLTTGGYAGALVSEYRGSSVPDGLVVTNAYYSGTVSCSGGTLLNDGVGTVITEEQLNYGYLAGKLSSAWTVESGNPPYLTALGGATAIEIDTAEELRKIGVDASYPLTGKYKLTDDIDLSETTWTVIGGIFSGVFDGNGHTISGMTSGSPDAPYTTTSGWGMFTELSGTVKNLKLEDLYFNVGAAGGEKPVGGICGYIRDGAVVENVYMSGSSTDVTSHQVRAGAIAGSARSAYTIRNCYIDVDVTGAYGGSVVDRQAGIAGLVGSTKQAGTISDCVYVGDVTLTTGGYAGALVSEYYGNTVEDTVLVVTDAYYSGTVTCENGTLLNDGVGTKITVDQLLNGYLSDKLSSAWTVDDGSVPYLKTFGSAPEIDDGTIKIDSAEKLSKIGVDANYPLSGRYKLTADIDLTGTTWTAIGGVFSGVFDGNGHKISGMTSGTPETTYTNASGWGIFAELSGTVKNLKLEDLYFNVGSENKPVGGICGYICAGAVVENVYISGEIIDITSRQVRMGAVAGSARGAFTVRNCYFDVDLTGGFGYTDGDRQVGIASIVGSTKQGGTISDCVCVGDVTLTTKGYAGAIVSEYYGNSVASTGLVVTNTYFAGALSYPNGSLLNDGVGSVITAEELLDGSLSDKLSDAWTVESGSAPYLTAFGENEMPLEDALTAVENALDGFEASVGTTKNDILSCARKAVSGTSVALSVESFTKERPTSENEGSVNVTVKITVDGVSETVTKTYSIPRIPGLDYEFTSSVKGRADGTISILLPESYKNEAYELYWGTSEGVSEKYSSLTTMEDIAVQGNTLIYIPESQTYIPEGTTHLYLTLDGAEIASFEIPAERRMTLGTAKYTFGVFSDVHFTTSAGRPNSSFAAAMDLYRDAGATFVVACGDVTTGGREAEYAQFTSTYTAGGYTMPFWTALGNHDILKWNLDSALTPEQALSNMKAAVNTFANVNHNAGSEYTVTVAEGENAGYDYTMSYGDELFIFMSVGVASNSSVNAAGNPINVDQKLADSQINWLEEILDQYYNVDKKDGQVFLIFHYYTLESGKYYSSATSDEWDAASSAALDGVLREYPGVIHFNGHNHFYFDADLNMYADEYVSIHVPSLTNPRTSRDGTEGSGTAYENYIVTVYEDYIIVNGVDAYTGTYAPHAMFMIADDSFTLPEEEEPEAPVFKSFSLTLNRGVSVNVKFTVSEEYLAANPDTKVVFSNGVEFDALAGTNTYTVNLTPVNIGTALKVACGGDEIDVSVETYVNRIKAASASALGLTEEKFADLVALVDSIVTYGKAAAGTLEGDVTADFTGVGTVTEQGDIFVGLGATLAESASAKLTVDTEKLDESYTLTITFGGETVISGKPVKDYVKNGAISITGIYAANYSDEITVTVYDGENAVASVSFTLNEYLNTLNSTATGTAVRNLIAATYNYGAATAKFAS
ncbi:MAG: metallophosphoesterase [Clostridia bacterium]|nr:metallophosphoesterase [Clostridia bacterium]